MDAVNNLCGTAIMLEDGVISHTGTSFDITRYYLNGNSKTTGTLTWNKSINFKTEFFDIVEIYGYSVISDSRICNSLLYKSESYVVEIDAKIKIKNGNIVFFISYFSNSGELLLVSDCYDCPSNYNDLGIGHFILNVPVPVESLNTGSYFIELSCVIHQMGWVMMSGNGQMMPFEFIDDSPATKMQFKANHPFTGSTRPGLFSIKLPWQIKYIDNK